MDMRGLGSLFVLHPGINRMKSTPAKKIDGSDGPGLKVRDTCTFMTESGLWRVFDVSPKMVF
ncbi:hypothetical protein DDZ15_02150 [Rhodohalobacter mucosus]|uniref:Uncharacterized protein n=1 Tax=Rhodohalobacter mucosus TaxID=2079485 RepID=A0A316TX63_9BACT|nr:hypothetical protein DDZ15_02150 [Rhodohalobacter mucosus]